MMNIKIGHFREADLISGGWKGFRRDRLPASTPLPTTNVMTMAPKPVDGGNDGSLGTRSKFQQQGLPQEHKLCGGNIYRDLQ
ncbi:hypothetical protein ACP70R_028297 [Stipagrostis hirtigluma subsp. patula]